MPTPTTKLAMQKPQGTEPQDVEVLNANFDILDKVAGGYVVNDGITPPDTDLFPGCVVIEKNSGWTWIAISNGVGGYKKKMIYFPMEGGLYTDAFTVPHSTSGNPTPTNNYADFDHNITSKGGQVSASGILLPDLSDYFSSLRWLVTVWCNWGTAGTGYRIMGFTNVNGSGAYPSQDGNVTATPVAGTATNMQANFIYTGTTAGGQRLVTALRQNSGSSINVETRFRVALDPNNCRSI